MTAVTGAPFSLSSIAPPATLSDLEFDRALDHVAARAVSQVGADAIRQRRPVHDTDTIVRELARVGELVHHLRDQGQFRPTAVPDISPELASLHVEGRALDADALLRVADAVIAMRENAALLQDRADALPLVNVLLVDVPDDAVARHIEQAIDRDGAVRDSASPEVARTRGVIRSTRKRLVSMLEGVARGVGEDSRVTLRGGRYVVSIPRDARREVRGLVHAQSASGASLFVEPEGAVELGNDLRIAEADEAQAVAQVFRDLSARVRSSLPELESGWHMSVQLDDLYARARYALDVDASVPDIVPCDGSFIIARGFHPLLREEPGAQPFTVALQPAGTLLISGPNAGGKTVLLKAVGLIAALAQSGVVPPIGEGSAIPVFRRIHVDIGDHQSIAQSLSTYSAHLGSLRAILETAGPGSLVLLDELGGGTDPVEGGALATAILEGLQARGATTVATTHLSDLKEAAASSECMTNASLEFDTETLAPTYRLQLGKPGRSYGLAIARRLGLAPDVVERAEAILPESIKTLDATLAELERREQALRDREASNEDQRLELEADAVSMAALQSQLDARDAELRTRVQTLERNGREQARTFLLESRRRVEDALALARAAVDEATAKQARRLVEEGVKEEGHALQRLEKLAHEKGWTVKGTGRRAKPEGRKPSTVAPQHYADVAAASQISVRGMRADEAESAVLSAIDDAVVADLPRLRVVHGKGTGVLRQVVVDLVRSDLRVARFTMAAPNQGGAGVTILEFT